MADTTTTTTKTTSTSKLAGLMNIFGGVNWQQLSDLVEGKDTLQQGTATVEAVAKIILEGATLIGVPFAGTAQAYEPMAEKLIELAEEYGPMVLGISDATQAAVNMNPPGHAGGKPTGL